MVTSIIYCIVYLISRIGIQPTPKIICTEICCINMISVELCYQCRLGQVASIYIRRSTKRDVISMSCFMQTIICAKRTFHCIFYFICTILGNIK